MIFKTLLALLFFRPTASYDDALNLNYFCAQHCDNHRGNGWKGSFQFHCRNVSDAKIELAKCSNACSKCPSFVCLNTTDSHIFDCPATSLQRFSDCAKRCDSLRKKGNLDSFSFLCDKTYADPAELANCHQDCEKCPRWVCEKHNSNSYYCPTADYNGVCKEICQIRLCNRRSRDMIPPPNLFAFTCDKFKQDPDDDGFTRCKDSCKFCPTNICDPEEVNSTWYCPALKDGILPPSPPGPIRSFKGRCHARCKKLRVGKSKASFKIQCHQAYDTLIENELCMDDCRKCPETVCQVYDDPKKQTQIAEFSCPATGKDLRMPPEEKYVFGKVGIPLFISVVFCFIFAWIAIILAALYYNAKRGRSHSASQTHGPPEKAHTQTQSEVQGAEQVRHVSQEVLKPEPGALPSDGTETPVAMPDTISGDSGLEEVKGTEVVSSSPDDGSTAIGDNAASEQPIQEDKPPDELKSAEETTAATKDEDIKPKAEENQPPPPAEEERQPEASQKESS